jgi:hypothetical protein
LIPRYGEHWAPKTEAWRQHCEAYQKWKNNKENSQRPVWNKKKPKTHTNIPKHVRDLLSPLLDKDPSTYHIFMDKEFSTKAILLWLEKKRTNLVLIINKKYIFLVVVLILSYYFL